MNFMGGGGGGGGHGYFYEDYDGKGNNTTIIPFSQSSSSSSSSSSSHHHKASNLPLPFTYNHHHPIRGWPLDPNYRTGGAANQDAYNDLPEAATGVGAASGGVMIEREHMFDKVVTPSDVGKLNRLVIPKQHAEKYFPLDSSSNEKGLLLNFEDRNGKPWRFRYSYWNSSQSYVMTKGWSRFVKEKKLHAGDIVSFQRGVGDSLKDRLFIDWRRRPDAPEMTSPFPHHFSLQRSVTPWNPLFVQHPPPLLPPQPPLSTLTSREHHYIHMGNHPNYGYASAGSSPYPYNSAMSTAGNPCSSPVIYFRPAAGAPQRVGTAEVERGRGGSNVNGGIEPMVFESVPVVQGKAAAKRLRLFGVNMECPISESDDCDILSSTIMLPQPHHHQQQPQHLSSSSPSSSIPSLQLRPNYKGKGSSFDI